MPPVVDGFSEEPVDDAARADASESEILDANDAVSPGEGQPKEEVRIAEQRTMPGHINAEFAEPDFALATVVAVGDSAKQVPEVGSVWIIENSIGVFSELQLELSSVERMPTLDQVFEHADGSVRCDDQLAKAHVAGNR